jgi:hypothetical protein
MRKLIAGAALSNLIGSIFDCAVEPPAVPSGKWLELGVAHSPGT